MPKSRENKHRASKPRSSGEPYPGFSRVDFTQLAIGGTTLIAIAAVVFFLKATSNRAPQSAPQEPSSASAERGSSGANIGFPPEPIPQTSDIDSEALSADEGPDALQLLNAGTQLLNDNRPDEAIEAYRQAAKLAPDDEDVFYSLGVAYARIQDFPQAIEAYSRALTIFPEYAEVHNNLGNAFVRQKQFEKAIHHFQKAIELLPDYAMAHNNLGSALGRSGQTQAAYEHFLKASQLEPNYLEAQFNVGNSLVILKRPEEARRVFTAILDKDPNYQYARWALEKLNKSAP